MDRDSDTYRFVEKAECGLWVEPENPDVLAEAILALYHDPDRRERLGRNGRVYVEARYTPQVVARQYASLLKRTAEGERGWQGEGEQGSGGARAFSRVVSQLKRGSFTSTEDLRQRILDFIDYFNKTMAKPFKWTYTGRPLTA
ncbi:MAG: glycosyltransferase [Anaerolineae bacterium]